MKVALVHDQLQEFGGAERVLVAFHEIFPKADVYTSFFNPETLGHHAKKFEGWNIRTTWTGKVPLLNKFYSPLRFITPQIWESLDLSGYDLVISSSGSYMSKGVITRSDTIHICYLHHPPRYLYFYETALEWQKYTAIKIYAYLINHGLRQWDYISSQRVDYFIANSEETKKRIEKFYRRDAEVIYPPVNIVKELGHPQGDYYITVSRLARAKHIEVLIEAANKMKLKLKIVGTGRDERYLKSIAGPTVEFLGYVPDTEMPDLFRNASAFLFSAADEEFGIAPIEAMGYGLPVIAYKSGGVVETVKDGVNGYLFEALDENSLATKVKKLESLNEDAYLALRKNARSEAEKYSFGHFKKQILEFIHSKMTEVNNARITGG